jgi:hypothetical protein
MQYSYKSWLSQPLETVEASDSRGSALQPQDLGADQVARHFLLLKI